MSALTSRTAALARRLATTTTTTASRTSILSRAAFTTTAPQHKTPVESAKETLKQVDRKVSDKLVDGINIGCTFRPAHTPLNSNLAL
jgi:guanyl-specific ribonuclease Sa